MINDASRCRVVRVKAVITCLKTSLSSLMGKIWFSDGEPDDLYPLSPTCEKGSSKRQF